MSIKDHRVCLNGKPYFLRGVLDQGYWPDGVLTPPTDEALKKYKVHPGDSVANLGYPHRTEANDEGFPVLRKGAIASYPLLPTKKSKIFVLSTNSFEGDSGGPVYLADPGRAVSGKDTEDVRLILGLVSAQRFLDEEAKMIYGTTKIRHRLGLANVVHASFIRETIERMP